MSELDFYGLVSIFGSIVLIVGGIVNIETQRSRWAGDQHTHTGESAVARGILTVIFGISMMIFGVWLLKVIY